MISSAPAPPRTPPLDRAPAWGSRAAEKFAALGAALFAKKSAKIQEVCNASYGTLAMIYNAKTKEEKLANSIVIPVRRRPS